MNFVKYKIRKWLGLPKLEDQIRSLQALESSNSSRMIDIFSVTDDYEKFLPDMMHLIIKVNELEKEIHALRNRKVPKGYKLGR